MKKTRILALILALAMCFALAACGTSDDTTDSGAGDTTDTTTPDNTTTPDDNAGEPSDSTGNEDNSQATSDGAQTEDTVAQVAEINDSELQLKVFKNDGAAIEDYTAVDFGSYSDSGETETLTIDSTSGLSMVEDGTIVSAELSDIAVGDMLIITRDSASGDISQIIICKTTQGA